MRTTLSTTQTQQLKIAPQLQQAIRLLQLSNQALELEINVILDKNPFLELESESPSDLLNKSFTREQSFDNFEYGFETKAAGEKYQEYQDWLINRESETTLNQHLLWQLNMGNFSESERLIALLIIDNINDNGYLEGTLEEIQQSFIQQYPEHEVSLIEIEMILQKIQRFDPVGVAARSLIECLSLQLLSFPKDTPWLKESIHGLQHLELIGKRDYTRLKKALNLNDEGLNSVLKILKALNPKPGREWLAIQKTNYITPDLTVRKKDGCFKVELNMNHVPKLRLNTEYINLMNRSGSERSNTLLKEYFNEARLFLHSIKHRQDTLLKVAEQIVLHQQDFFEHGPSKLRPLILQTIAKECDLHESSVSRICTQKYVDCPNGVFELKYFFSPSACDNMFPKGVSFSSKAIQAFVQKLIEQESPTNPLTDDTIIQKLALEGIKISRRTVAKYREKMKIPSSHERRSLNLFNDRS